MATLSVFRGTELTHTVELTGRDLRIGRADQNDIVLADPDHLVSRFHAEVKWEGQRPILIDLNSQNGLRVNGASARRVPLESGEVVGIGAYTLTIGTALPIGHPAMAAPTPAGTGAGTGTGTRPARYVPPRSRRLVLVGGVGVAAVAGVVVAGSLGLFRRTADAPPVATTLTDQAVAPTPVPTPTAPPVQQPPPDPVVTTGSARSNAPPRARPSRGASAIPAAPPVDAAAEERTREQRQAAELATQAYAAVQREAFAEASSLLEQLRRLAPPAYELDRLATAIRDGQRIAVRRRLEAASAAESRNDFPAAMHQYQEVAQIDSSMTGLVTEAIRGVRDKMRREGTLAFSQAVKQQAAGQLAEAAALYQKAFDLLPDDDPNRQLAKTRLDAIRRGKSLGS